MYHSFFFQFDLSGCEKLTDNTFAELHTLNRDGHTWSMKCTGVNYMNNTNIGIETKGCPSYGGKYITINPYSANHSCR